MKNIMLKMLLLCNKNGPQIMFISYKFSNCKRECLARAESLIVREKDQVRIAYAIEISFLPRIIGKHIEYIILQLEHISTFYSRKM